MLCFCPNKRRSFEPFMCLDLVLERWQSFLLQIFILFPSKQVTATATHTQLSGLKSAYVHACKQSIFFWSYKKSTFITVHLDENPLKCYTKQKKKKKKKKRKEKKKFEVFQVSDYVVWL